MIFFFEIMGGSIEAALQKYDLTPYKVSELATMDKSTIKHILTGECGNVKSYNNLLKWMEENYPKVYKDAVNTFIDKLSELRMD